METTETILVHKIRHSAVNEIDWNNLEFGKYHSDHMLVCDFKYGEWQQARITPFANLSLSPDALALHYGQTIFEGMKAFCMKDGRINLFRTEKHYERFVRSAERMCMAVIPKESFMEGLRQLIRLDRQWVPAQPGSALCIRPFMIATEARLGLRVSGTYRFLIITGPVGPLYQQPISVKVETHFVRAAHGGTGYAKCGGNYGASFYPTQQAKQEGFDQVLWTDANEHQYIEESGMMNVMFVINGALVTPPLSDSILEGITRDTFITLAKDAGIGVEERPVSIAELEEGFRKKIITEAFGVGTAAVASPIKTIAIGEKRYQPDPVPNSIAALLKGRLERIRSGEEADVHHWNEII